jgi:hypothetical protein
MAAILSPVCYLFVKVSSHLFLLVSASVVERTVVLPIRTRVWWPLEDMHDGVLGWQ